MFSRQDVKVEHRVSVVLLTSRAENWLVGERDAETTEEKHRERVEVIAVIPKAGGDRGEPKGRVTRELER